MKINRIAIIAVLAILTVVLAGSASAFDLGFLTGDGAAQDVNIGGIDFTIPAGFTENRHVPHVFFPLSVAAPSCRP